MTGDRGQRHKESIPVGMQKNAESLEGRMRTAEREREREQSCLRASGCPGHLIVSVIQVTLYLKPERKSVEICGVVKAMASARV